MHYPHIFGLRIFVAHFNDMHFHFLDTIRSLIEGHNFMVNKMIYKYLRRQFMKRLRIQPRWYPKNSKVLRLSLRRMLNKINGAAS